MALYNFKDKKSRKQLAIAITYANDVKQANADGLLAYQTKMAALVGSRNEWELEDYNEALNETEAEALKLDPT